REANGMDCRVKPGNDDGWVWASLKFRTPLRFRGNDGEGRGRRSFSIDAAIVYRGVIPIL
ncbi:MAG: hypothetical protein MI824_14200, partial [Hyphomicrobiales bacterium]|nr:hypothetical protein [Hyphomicrobiales bacterium]